MLEYPVPPLLETSRDLSRAEWQRGIGMVVLSHLCDQLIIERAGMSVSEILDTGRGMLPAVKPRNDMPELWAHAYSLAGAYFERPRTVDAITFPDALERDTYRHTFAKSVKGTFSEGLNAQRYFPLNFASLIESEAAAQSVDGYKLESLTSIAGLFRNPAFHDILTTCAFTVNGIWEDLATAPITISRSHHHTLRGSYSEHWVTFHDGNVQVGADLARILRSELTINNKNASPPNPWGTSESLDFRPSSGCPVNHTAPHSTVIKEHRDELDAISTALGVETNVLLRRRATTPIIALTLGFADFLERVDYEYAEPPLPSAGTID